MKVTFFGHGEIEYNLEIRERLQNEVEKLINYGADEFLIGGYGNFDILVTRVIVKLKEQYPHIKSILVIPYLNREYNVDMYDDTVYPDIEDVHPKLAILKRNQWMVDISDVIISYVCYSFGGAYMAMTYAQKKNKKIIKLAK